MQEAYDYAERVGNLDIPVDDAEIAFERAGYSDPVYGGVSSVTFQERCFRTIEKLRGSLLQAQVGAKNVEKTWLEIVTEQDEELALVRARLHDLEMELARAYTSRDAAIDGRDSANIACNDAENCGRRLEADLDFARTRIDTLERTNDEVGDELLRALLARDAAERQVGSLKTDLVALDMENSDLLLAAEDRAVSDMKFLAELTFAAEAVRERVLQVKALLDPLGDIPAVEAALTLLG